MGSLDVVFIQFLTVAAAGRLDPTPTPSTTSRPRRTWSDSLCVGLAWLLIRAVKVKARARDSCSFLFDPRLGILPCGTQTKHRGLDRQRWGVQVQPGRLRRHFRLTLFRKQGRRPSPSLPGW